MKLRTRNLFTLASRRLLCILVITFIIITSCEQESVTPETSQNESDLARVAKKLNSAGFDTSEGFRKFENGYIVEYDIFVTEKMIDDYTNNLPSSKNGRSKQYTTTNLVTKGNRTLLVFMGTGFGAYMQNSFDAALARYNALNLSLTFQRTTTQAAANISILPFFENSTTLGISAGFPTLNGNPANTISLNTFYFNDNSARADAATVIAHEIGHAIGFRHTDYMNRTFSCGGTGVVNETAAGVGANHIPGTPTDPAANSWMLACSNRTDRPFTSSDIIALETTYPKGSRVNYSFLTGPEVWCQGQPATYDYYFYVDPSIPMVPYYATFTIYGGVFLPSGATSITLNRQAGATRLQVRWDGPGYIRTVSAWTLATRGTPQYQETLVKNLTINCGQ